MRRFVLLLGLVLLTAARARAAEEPAVTVQARLDRVQMTVGDRLGYELLVSAPPNFKAELPPVPTKTFGEWEVGACETVPAVTGESGTSLGWRCTLTIWEVGYHALPTQIVKVTNPDGSSGRASTQAVAVEVTSVLDANPVDIKPLKPQLALSEQANYLLLIGLSLLAILVAGALALGVVYWRRHRRVPAPVVAPPPARDPIATAMAELDRIAKLDLVAQQRIEEHYTLITDVLRRYIAERFGVPALERTTSEVRSALLSPAVLQRRDFLLALLAEADGVKFARYLPTSVDAIAMLEHARQAILATR
ncbi:MAG TPA: hypothetical protein VGE07_04385 [Herpetosiphonaceae bacterium]